MQGVRRFTVELGVSDPAAPLGGARLLELAGAALRRRCYQGTYVRAVRSARQLTPVRIHDDSETAASVAAEVDADVVTYAAGDVVTGLTVAAHEQFLYGLSDEDATGRLVAVLQGGAEGGRGWRPRPGARVGARVARAEYVGERVVAVAEPLACVRGAAAFAAEGKLTRSDAGALAALAAQVREMLAARAELQARRPDDLAFFDGLLHARADAGGARQVESRAAPAWAGAGAADPPGAATVNLLDLVADAEDGSEVDMTGVWALDPAVARSAPLICRAAGAPPARWGEPTASPPAPVVAWGLRAVYNALVAANGMLAMYPHDAIADLGDLWEMMRARQETP